MQSGAAPLPPFAPLSMPPTAGQLPGRRVENRWIIAVLAVGGTAYGLSQSMVIPALPDIERALHFSASDGAWLLTAYLIAAGVLTAILGRLGDMFGRRRVLLVSLSVFAAGCAIDTAAHWFPLLILGRVIQAAGAGVYPLAFGILRERLTPERLGPAIGLMSATYGIGGGVGPVAGGLLAQYASYRWIFASLGLVTLVAVVLARWLVPEQPRRAVGRVDWSGAVLFTAGLAIVLLGIDRGSSWGWGASGTIGLLAGGLVIIAIWVVLERRTSAPLVDLRMMRLRGVMVANGCGFVVGWSSYVGLLLVTLFVQQPRGGIGLGWGATRAGAIFVPQGLALLVIGRYAGSLGQRLGARVPLIIGAALMIAPTLLLAVLDRQAWFLLVSSAVIGFGTGLSLAALPNLILETVPLEQTGVATGVNTLVRIVGAAVGTQVVITIIDSHTASGGSLYANSGFVVAFLLTAVLCVLGTALAVLAPGPPSVVPVLPASADASG